MKGWRRRAPWDEGNGAKAGVKRGGGGDWFNVAWGGYMYVSALEVKDVGEHERVPPHTRVWAVTSFNVGTENQK